jgi:hypothetical protein
MLLNDFKIAIALFFFISYFAHKMIAQPEMENQFWKKYNLEVDRFSLGLAT